MPILFQNRTEAGQMLGRELTAYTNHADLLVLGLPRGGVPVAFEVAKLLNAPLDICLVRKLGVPGNKELAMGAIASGGIRVLNQDLVNSLGISQKIIDEVAAEELRELQRRDRVYRGNRPQIEVKNRTIILVDDGIATGSTMRAAIATLRQQQPKTIIVAVPVASPTTCTQLKAEVEVVCLKTPEPMYAIGICYADFSQTSDKQVCDLLQRK